MTTELSIVLVLEHYGANLSSIPLVGWHSIRCPFHDDHVASGRMNVADNAFKCHACGVSGDAIKIIETQEYMNYGEAVGFAREVLGASVEKVSRTVSKSRKRRPLGSERWKDILE